MSDGRDQRTRAMKHTLDCRITKASLTRADGSEMLARIENYFNRGSIVDQFFQKAMPMDPSIPALIQYTFLVSNKKQRRVGPLFEDVMKVIKHVFDEYGIVILKGETDVNFSDMIVSRGGSVYEKALKMFDPAATLALAPDLKTIPASVSTADSGVPEFFGSPPHIWKVRVLRI